MFNYLLPKFGSSILKSELKWFLLFTAFQWPLQEQQNGDNQILGRCCFPYRMRDCTVGPYRKVAKLQYEMGLLTNRLQCRSNRGGFHLGEIYCNKTAKVKIEKKGPLDAIGRTLKQPQTTCGYQNVLIRSKRKRLATSKKRRFSER